MKEKFSNLNSYQKTVIVSTIVALVAAIVLTVLSIVKVLEIFVLIGTVLGALLVIISYLLL